MTQTIERLELSSEAYRTLERLAQSSNSTLSGALETLIRQTQPQEIRRELVREYHELVEQKLARTLTAEGKQRMKEIGEQITAIV